MQQQLHSQSEAELGLKPGLQLLRMDPSPS